MLDSKEILIRLIVASLLGALIGLERERKDWAAGLRTHMMVSVGSCLFMIVSAFGFADILGTENVSLDPSRIAAQVVSGIGFLGAGTILFLKQGIVRGLTTAAGLWTVAAIGLATGGGMYFAASVTTVIALIILWAIQPLEKLYAKKFKHQTLQVTAYPEANTQAILDYFLDDKEIELSNISVEKNKKNISFRILFDKTNQEEVSKIMLDMKEMPAVKEIFWVK